MPTHLIGRVTIVPSTATVPDVGGNSPVTNFIKVDLPQPEGPTTATYSPSPTSMLTRFRASRPSGPPKDKLTSASSTNGRERGAATWVAPARATAETFMRRVPNGRCGRYRIVLAHRIGQA